MKKKTIIIETIIATIFIAASAFGGSVSYEPLKPKSYECLIFELELTQLHAVEVVDERGSKYVHTDFVPRTLRQVFYYKQTSGKKYYQSWQAKVNSNGKSLNGVGENRQDIMVMNPKEGGTNGFIAFVFDITSLDKFTPSVKCHLVGTFEGEWLEEEQRYILNSGRGVVSAHSTPTTWSARDFMEQAVPSIQSAIAPAWGTFTVRRAILTETEIVTLINK